MHTPRNASTQHTLQFQKSQLGGGEVTLPALEGMKETEVPIQAASALQSELKVTPTGMGWTEGGGPCAAVVTGV